MHGLTAIGRSRPRAASIKLTSALVLATLAAASTGCDDDGPSGTDEGPVITAITPSTVVGGDSLRISGREFGTSASEATVSVIGDTIPVTSLSVQSVADTSIAVQVPLNLAGSLQARVSLAGRTSAPATLIVIPSAGGLYSADATVLANPCQVEPDLIVDYAVHLGDISWRVTQAARPATGTLTISTADGVVWNGDVGPIAADPFRASADLGVDDFVGDLELIVAPARFVGTLTLHQPGSLDCGVLLGLDAMRTSAPILEARAARTPGLPIPSPHRWR